MAYYYSSGYTEDDLGEYNLTPYGASYDSASTHGLMAYPSYESNNHQLFEYDYNSIPCYGAYYNPPHSYSSIAYSTSTFSEPRFIEYDPNAMTRYVISYSTVEFNVPEFEDYDPTPYGGGFDIAQTYGKPLPASDEICHPRSVPPDPNALALDGATYGSITLPSGKEETDGQATKIDKGLDSHKEEEQQLHDGSSDKGQGLDSHKEEEQQLHDGSSDKGQGLDSHKEEPYQGDNYYPWSGEEQHGYEYDKPVPQPPSGYGLEAMDLCESLFGYWPCLSREKRRGDHQDCTDEGSNNRSNNGDQWKGTADYLFGSSYPYGERRGVGGSNGYGDPNYGYQRHYQEQPLYRQVYYDE